MRELCFIRDRFATVGHDGQTADVGPSVDVALLARRPKAEWQGKTSYRPDSYVFKMAAGDDGRFGIEFLAFVEGVGYCIYWPTRETAKRLLQCLPVLAGESTRFDIDTSKATPLSLTLEGCWIRETAMRLPADWRIVADDFAAGPKRTIREIVEQSAVDVTDLESFELLASGTLADDATFRYRLVEWPGYVECAETILAELSRPYAGLVA